jgi:hypothetical protein
MESTIINQAVQYAGYKFSAYCGQVLVPMAKDDMKLAAFDLDDPQAREFFRISGTLPDRPDLPRWVYAFQQLLDNMEVRYNDKITPLSVESAVMYFWTKEMGKMGTSAFSQVEVTRQYEELHPVWLHISGIETIDEYPEGFWDGLIDCLKDKRQYIQKNWKEGDFKTEAVSTIGLALTECGA